MPLSKAQIAVLKSPEVRKRLQTRAADFAYIDKLLKEVGESCPRLPAVWDRIFSGLSAEVSLWLSKNFPGMGFVASVGQQPEKPIPVRPLNVVNRAVQVLQSYKKAT